MDFKEIKDWQSWSEQHPHESTNLLKKIWEASGSYKNNYHPDVEQGLVALKSRMGQHREAKIVRLSPAKIALRIAAGLALLLVATYFLKDQFIGSDNRSIVSTPSTDTKEFSLSDGSIVTLNESSEMSFDPEFSKKIRKVVLEGEAFFKIARDVNRPFVIETEVGLVKVLGTSFNIRSYPNEDLFEVYVASGKVKVELKDAVEPVELNAGEFLRYNKSNKKALKGKDKTGLSNGWLTGVINFKGQNIPTILMGMERLFRVKIDLKTDQRPDCLQTLTIRKGQLQETLDVLKTSCPKLKFTKDGNGGYEVTGVCCN